MQPGKGPFDAILDKIIGLCRFAKERPGIAPEMRDFLGNCLFATQPPAPIAKGRQCAPPLLSVLAVLHSVQKLAHRVGENLFGSAMVAGAVELQALILHGRDCGLFGSTERCLGKSGFNGFGIGRAMGGKSRRGEREEGGGGEGHGACHGRFPVLVGDLHKDERQGGGFNPGQCEYFAGPWRSRHCQALWQRHAALKRIWQAATTPANLRNYSDTDIDRL